MSDCTAKMHQMRIRWGSLLRSPDLKLDLRGLFLRRKMEGKRLEEKYGREGKGISPCAEILNTSLNVYTPAKHSLQQ